MSALDEFLGMVHNLALADIMTIEPALPPGDYQVKFLRGMTSASSGHVTALVLASQGPQETPTTVKWTIDMGEPVPDDSGDTLAALTPMRWRVGASGQIEGVASPLDAALDEAEARAKTSS
jgi:hypothetical protein